MLHIILFLISVGYSETVPCSDQYTICDSESCADEYYQCLDDNIVYKTDAYYQEISSSDTPIVEQDEDLQEITDNEI